MVENSMTQRVEDLIKSYNNDYPNNKIAPDDIAAYHIECILQWREALNDPLHNEQQASKYKGDLHKAKELKKWPGIDKIVFYKPGSKEKITITSSLFIHFIIQSIGDGESELPRGGRPKQNSLVKVVLETHIQPLINQGTPIDFIATIFNQSTETFKRALSRASDKT